MKIQNAIGKYCRDFRKHKLQLTLVSFCDLTNTNFKTLSAFELGRSTNIEHVFKYLDLCDESNKKEFIIGFALLLGEIKNG